MVVSRCKPPNREWAQRVTDRQRLLRFTVMRIASLTALVITGACATNLLPAADVTRGTEPIGPATTISEPLNVVAFVNHKVSSRKISVNQPVRLEFTTMPRQVEGVDIAAVVTNGITMAGGSTWRLNGKPSVAEDTKTKTVTIGVTLYPRTTGDLALPAIPLSWLSRDTPPSFGQVTVMQSISIGGETRALPKEYDGVGGFLWGARLDDLMPSQISATAVSVQGDKTVAKVSGSLELGFRSGELSDATLLASGITLEQSRVSFCERWGLPASDVEGTLTWIFGWTRISASAMSEPAKADGTKAEGVRLELVREDLAAKQAANQVRSRVFSLLEDAPKK